MKGEPRQQHPVLPRPVPSVHSVPSILSHPISSVLLSRLVLSRSVRSSHPVCPSSPTSSRLSRMSRPFRPTSPVPPILSVPPVPSCPVRQSVSPSVLSSVPSAGAPPRSFDGGGGLVLVRQTHLSPNSDISSDFVHFILNILKNLNILGKFLKIKNRDFWGESPSEF